MTTYWTSPGATGNGLGTTTPGSITTCENLCNPGDTVMFKDGTYTDANSNAIRSITQRGSPSADGSLNITWQSQNPLGALIQWTGAAGSMWTLDNGATTFGAQTAYRTFDGFLCDGRNNGAGNGAMGQFINGQAFTHHVTVKNCRVRFTGAGAYGFHNCDYITIHDCDAHRFGDTGGPGFTSAYNFHYPAAINFFGDSTNTDFHHVVARCTATGGFDSSANHTDGNGFIIDCPTNNKTPYTNNPKLLVTDCVFSEIGGRGGQTLQGNGLWVVNCTFFGNGNDSTANAGAQTNLGFRSASGCFSVNNIFRSGSFARNMSGTGTAGDVVYRANIHFGGGADQTLPSSDVTGSDTIGGTAYPRYQSVDPAFIAPMTLAVDAYQTATPGWQLGTNLQLQAGSPGLAHGVDPRLLTTNQNYRNFLGAWSNRDVNGVLRPGFPA